MLKSISALTLLLFTISLCSAQSSKLLTDAQDKTIIIEHDEADVYTDGVLDIIDKTEDPKTISYQIKEHREIIKNGSQLMVRIYVGNLVRVDDYSFQKFKINEYLTPSLINYTYEFKDGDGKMLKTEDVSNAIFKSGAPLVKFSHNSFGGEENTTISLSNIKLSFSKKDLKSLDAFIQTINSYYDVDAQLSLMNQELDQLAIDSIELLQENSSIIEENLEAMSNIKSMRFASKLQLAANDPLGYKSNFGRTDERNKKIKKELAYQIKYMHETYHKKGLNNLTWGDTSRAEELFYLSIDEKLNYPPPYYELAHLDFLNHNYQKAIDSCKMIIKKLKPDNDTRYQVIQLAQKIIYVYIDSIHLMIDNQSFDRAVTKLNETEKYANSIEGIKRFSEFNDIYTKLYQAYYNQLVNETETLLNDKFLIEAHKNIDSLDRFRTVHKQYISNAEKEYELQNKLYVAWIDNGKENKELGLPNNTIIAFTKAKAICQEYIKVLCTEELAILLHESRQAYYALLLVDARKVIKEQDADSALAILADAKNTLIDWKLKPIPLADSVFIEANQLKYEQLIYEGDIAFSNYDSRRALAFYNEAVELSAQLDLENNSNLPYKIADAATASIVMYCDHGSTQIDALQINKAFHYLEKARTLAEQYNVMSNPEVSIAIEILEGALNAGECSKAMHEYNVQLNTSKRFIEQHDFKHADQALDKTMEVFKTYKDCSLDSVSIIRLKEDIKPIKYYREQILKSALLIEQNSFNAAITVYLSAGEYYQDSINNYYEVVHEGLFEHIKNDRSDGLRDYAIRYYAEQNETDKSLELLYRLYKDEYNPNWVKKSQVSLGVQLAQDDFKEDPNQSVDRKLLEYTKNDKWFNHLKKAYLSQWKKF